MSPKRTLTLNEEGKVIFDLDLSDVISLPEPKPKPASYLTTYDFAKLNNACLPIREAFGHRVYLVGSALTKQDYRDIDVRVILDDEQFDDLFKGKVFIWSVINLGIGAYLRDVTGLPIDFQIQRRTEANEKHTGMRNPIGTDARPFAGGGDGTGLLA